MKMTREVVSNGSPTLRRPFSMLYRLTAVVVGWTLVAGIFAMPAEAAKSKDFENLAGNLFEKTYKSKKAFQSDADDLLADSRKALPDSSYDKKIDTRTLPDGEISKTDPGTGFQMTRKTRRTQEIWEKWQKGDTEKLSVSGTYKVNQGPKRPSEDSLKDRVRAKHQGNNQSVSRFNFDWKDDKNKVHVDYVLTTEKEVKETKHKAPSKDDLKQKVKNSVSGFDFDFNGFDFNDNKNKVTVSYSYKTKEDVTKKKDVQECTPKYKTVCEEVKDGEKCEQVKDGEKCTGSGNRRKCEPKYKTVCKTKFKTVCKEVKDGEKCKTVTQTYTVTETKTHKNQSKTFDYDSYIDIKTVKDNDNKSANFPYDDDIASFKGSAEYVVADTKQYEKPVKEVAYGNWKVHYVVPPPSDFTEDSASSVNKSLDFGVQTTQTRKTLALPYAAKTSGTTTLVEFKSVPYGPGGANKKIATLSLPSVSEAPVKTYVTQAGEWTTEANMSAGSRTISSAAGNRTLYSSELTSNPSVVLGGSTSRKQSGADNSRASLPATKPASSGSTFGAFKTLAIEDLVLAGQAKKADKDLDDDDEEDDEKDKKNDKKKDEKKDEKKTHDPGKGKKGD